MTYYVVEGTDCKNLVSDAEERHSCTDLSSMYICIYCIRRVLNNLILQAIYSEWLEFRYCLAFDDKIRPFYMFSNYLFRETRCVLLRLEIVQNLYFLII